MVFACFMRYNEILVNYSDLVISEYSHSDGSSIPHSDITRTTNREWLMKFTLVRALLPWWYFLLLTQITPLRVFLYVAGEINAL